MSTDDIYQQIHPLLQTQLERQGWQGTIDRDSNLFHLGLDSIGVMDLLMAVENQFQIVFADDELRPELFEKVEALIQIVETKCAHH